MKFNSIYNYSMMAAWTILLIIDVYSIYVSIVEMLGIPLIGIIIFHISLGIWIMRRIIKDWKTITEFSEEGGMD